MPGSVSSHISEHSVTNSHIDCPYCQKSYQMKSLFHHIRINHISQFLENTQKKWIEEAEKGRPLKMIFETDIDEELGHSNMTVIYGCLSSDKCFATEERAMRHFKHNPDHLKKHNSQLKKLKKEYEEKKRKEQKEREKNPVRFLVQNALRDNDSKLIDALWRGINHWKQGCDLAVSLGNHKFKDDYEYVWSLNPRKTSGWSDQVKRYEKYCKQAVKLLEEDCKQSSKLLDLYNNLWSFLMTWIDNYKEVTDLDPRLYVGCKECIIVKRDEHDMDEEMFFMANNDMPFPTVQLLKPIQAPKVSEPEPKEESESEPEVVIPSMDKKQTKQFLVQFPPNSGPWKQAFTGLISNKLHVPPEIQAVQSQFPKIITDSKVKKQAKQC